MGSYRSSGWTLGVGTVKFRNNSTHLAVSNYGLNVKVSVVIPTLNEAANITAAVISAIEAQASEVIVADGGSDDETLEVARQLGCETVSSPPGRAQQMNAGAEIARGDALLFLHADNRLPRDAIEQICQAFRQSESAKFGGFVQEIDAPQRIYRWLERGNAYRVRRWGLVYGDQAMFVRSSTFRAVGGFPDVALMEDVLVSKKLRSLHQPLLLAGPLNVSARRWAKSGPLRQTFRNWCLLAAFKLGVSPKRLVRFYAPHRKNIKP